MAVAAFCTFGAAFKAQTAANPQDFDIAGVRLGITVEQAKAALHAYNPAMTVQVQQSPSQIGPGSFTSVVVGTTGQAYGKGDGILIAFTETQGNRAYLISRVLTYDETSPAPTNVLMQQVTQKYGKPTSMTADPAWTWAFDPDGRPSTTNLCGPLQMGGFMTVGQFKFPYGSTAPVRCGAGLVIFFGSPNLATHVQEVLVDGQLEFRNLAAIEKVHDDAEAKRLQQLKDKAQQQSPF
jgi:hypothetical protein